MSYRPITDVWILARSKVKYFGAYPAGFLSRARDLLGVTMEDRVLHVCGGRVRDYPFKGVGPQDITMDMDRAMNPDFALDAGLVSSYQNVKDFADGEKIMVCGVLADPPYTEDFAGHYKPGREFFPKADDIVKHSISILPVGGRVGILSLHWPRYPKKLARQVAVVAVYIGNGNLGRTYAVYERIA